MQFWGIGGNKNGQGAADLNLIHRSCPNRLWTEIADDFHLCRIARSRGNVAERVIAFDDRDSAVGIHCRDHGYVAPRGVNIEDGDRSHARSERVPDAQFVRVRIQTVRQRRHIAPREEDAITPVGPRVTFG